MEPQAPVPADVGKSLRCCTGCKLVKSVAQFYDTGCENGCFSEDQDVEEFITAKFSGVITIMDPETSWAAKWLHCSRRVPGCYALALTMPSSQEM